MALSPVAQHLIGDLAGVTNRLGYFFYNLMSARARVAIRILGLILTHAATAITRLALLHDALPDPIVRQTLQCLRICTRQIRVSRWCLSMER